MIITVVTGASDHIMVLVAAVEAPGCTELKVLIINQIIRAQDGEPVVHHELTGMETDTPADHFHQEVGEVTENNQLWNF